MKPKNNSDDKIIGLFNKPKIISVTADVNEGKSMLLYHIIETLRTNHHFNLYYYGLRLDVKKATQVYSVAEMEGIRNSILIVDELSSLFDLDNRKVKTTIENTLRLINHNNNILLLCGVPENFKKFISAKIDMAIFKKCTIADFINGSRIKNVLMGFKGNERGSEVLNLPIDQALLYDGKHYNLFSVPYYARYDSKKNNVPIIVRNNVQKTLRVKREEVENPMKMLEFAQKILEVKHDQTEEGVGRH